MSQVHKGLPREKGYADPSARKSDTGQNLPFPVTSQKVRARAARLGQPEIAPRDLGRSLAGVPEIGLVWQ